MNCVNYLLPLAIIAALINSGFCIKCYNCVSTTNKECLDPSEHPNLKSQECSSELLRNLSNQVKQYAQSFGAAIGIDIDKSTKHLEDSLVCQKIVSTVNNEKVIIRGCQLKDTANSDACKTVQKIGETISHCSLCDDDGCNSGHWMAPLSVVATLLPALILVLPTIF